MRSVVVTDVFRSQMMQRPLDEDDEMVAAFLLHPLHPAFDERVPV